MTEQTQEKVPTFTRLRALLFLAFSLLIGVIVIVLMTWWVLGSAPRSVAIAVDESVIVEEYITLPDDDSYPAALAITANETIYTGSYASGALWQISSDRVIREVEGVRDRVGSITGLDVAPDGTLYILDRVVALDAQGAVIWKYADDELTSIVQIPNNETVGVVLPDDIAVDAQGFIYISDRDPARVWRYSADGENLGVWWTPPPATEGEDGAPTGLAYNPTNNHIVITDSNRDRIYSVPASVMDLAEANENTNTLYSDNNNDDYGLDGIHVTSTGDIYVALLNWNRVARLDDNNLTILARDFRGASDVVYAPTKDALFVTNWNQFSLGFATSPQLPFALDIVDLSPDPIAE